MRPLCSNLKPARIGRRRRLLCCNNNHHTYTIIIISPIITPTQSSSSLPSSHLHNHHHLSHHHTYTIIIISPTITPTQSSSSLPSSHLHNHHHLSHQHTYTIIIISPIIKHLLCITRTTVTVYWSAYPRRQQNFHVSWTLPHESLPTCRRKFDAHTTQWPSLTRHLSIVDCVSTFTSVYQCFFCRLKLKLKLGQRK